MCWVAPVWVDGMMPALLEEPPKSLRKVHINPSNNLSTANPLAKIGLCWFLFRCYSDPRHGHQAAWLGIAARIHTTRRCGTNFCGCRGGQGQRCADALRRTTPGKRSTLSSTCSERPAISARATTSRRLGAWRNREGSKLRSGLTVQGRQNPLTCRVHRRHASAPKAAGITR
jgi:hypothetical protein